jgi:hypothetical protein
MRFTAANIHEILDLPQQVTSQHCFRRTPSNAVLASIQLMASQASPASCNDSMGEEVFLHRSPLLFDSDFE